MELQQCASLFVRIGAQGLEGRAIMQGTIESTRLISPCCLQGVQLPDAPPSLHPTQVVDAANSPNLLLLCEYCGSQHESHKFTTNVIRLAAQGYAGALYQLGCMHALGFHAPVDMNRAIALWYQAMETDRVLPAAEQLEVYEWLLTPTMLRNVKAFANTFNQEVVLYHSIFTELLEMDESSPRYVENLITLYYGAKIPYPAWLEESVDITEIVERYPILAQNADPQGSSTPMSDPEVRTMMLARSLLLLWASHTHNLETLVCILLAELGIKQSDIQDVDAIVAGKKPFPIPTRFMSLHIVNAYVISLVGLGSKACRPRDIQLLEYIMIRQGLTRGSAAANFLFAEAKLLGRYRALSKIAAQTTSLALPQSSSPIGGQDVSAAVKTLLSLLSNQSATVPLRLRSAILHRLAGGVIYLRIKEWQARPLRKSTLSFIGHHASERHPSTAAEAERFDRIRAHILFGLCHPEVDEMLHEEDGWLLTIREACKDSRVSISGRSDEVRDAMTLAKAVQLLSMACKRPLDAALGARGSEPGPPLEIPLQALDALAFTLSLGCPEIGLFPRPELAKKLVKSFLASASRARDSEDLPSEATDRSGVSLFETEEVSSLHSGAIRELGVLAELALSQLESEVSTGSEAQVVLERILRDAVRTSCISQETELNTTQNHLKLSPFARGYVAILYANLVTASLVEARDALPLSSLWAQGEVNSAMRLLDSDLLAATHSGNVPNHTWHSTVAALEGLRAMMENPLQPFNSELRTGEKGIWTKYRITPGNSIAKAWNLEVAGQLLRDLALSPGAHPLTCLAWVRVSLPAAVEEAKIVSQRVTRKRRGLSDGKAYVLTPAELNTFQRLADLELVLLRLVGATAPREILEAISAFGQGSPAHKDGAILDAILASPCLESIVPSLAWSCARQVPNGSDGSQQQYLSIFDEWLAPQDRPEDKPLRIDELVHSAVYSEALRMLAQLYSHPALEARSALWGTDAWLPDRVAELLGSDYEPAEQDDLEESECGLGRASEFNSIANVVRCLQLKRREGTAAEKTPRGSEWARRMVRIPLATSCLSGLQVLAQNDCQSLAECFTPAAEEYGESLIGKLGLVSEPMRVILGLPLAKAAPGSLKSVLKNGAPEEHYAQRMPYEELKIGQQVILYLAETIHMPQLLVSATQGSFLSSILLGHASEHGPNSVVSRQSLVSSGSADDTSAPSLQSTASLASWTNILSTLTQTSSSATFAQQADIALKYVATSEQECTMLQLAQLYLSREAWGEAQVSTVLNQSDDTDGDIHQAAEFEDLALRLIQRSMLLRNILNSSKDVFEAPNSETNAFAPLVTILSPISVSCAACVGFQHLSSRSGANPIPILNSLLLGKGHPNALLNGDVNLLRVVTRVAAPPAPSLYLTLAKALLTGVGDNPPDPSIALAYMKQGASMGNVESMLLAATTVLRERNATEVQVKPDETTEAVNLLWKAARVRRSPEAVLALVQHYKMDTTELLGGLADGNQGVDTASHLSDRSKRELVHILKAHLNRREPAVKLYIALHALNKWKGKMSTSQPSKAEIIGVIRLLQDVVRIGSDSSRVRAARALASKYVSDLITRADTDLDVTSELLSAVVSHELPVGVMLRCLRTRVLEALLKFGEQVSTKPPREAEDVWKLLELHRSRPHLEAVLSLALAVLESGVAPNSTVTESQITAPLLAVPGAETTIQTESQRLQLFNENRIAAAAHLNLCLKALNADDGRKKLAVQLPDINPKFIDQELRRLEFLLRVDSVLAASTTTRNVLRTHSMGPYNAREAMTTGKQTHCQLSGSLDLKQLLSRSYHSMTQMQLQVKTARPLSLSLPSLSSSPHLGANHSLSKYQSGFPRLRRLSPFKKVSGSASMAKALGVAILLAKVFHLGTRKK